MGLRDIINKPNVLAYAKAGIDVARAAQRLSDDGYKCMIVPSRGAVPFLRVAKSYYRQLVISCMPQDDRLTKGMQARFGPLTLALDVPFTADAGRIGVEGLKSAHIRRFWARVVAAIVRRQVDNPHYRFFRFVRDEVCQVGHHDSLEWRMESERFLFIDTVVSGRAVCEIVEGFEAEGLDQIHYILLLDENGAAMRQPYAARIHALAAAGRATLIKVPSLFTEDQGPAVSGVWSVVVPKLMDLVRYEPAMGDGFAGAGLYYHEVRQRPDASNVQVTKAVARLDQLLFEAMHVAVDPNEVFEDLEHLGSEFSGDAALQTLEGLPTLFGRGLDESIEAYLAHIEGHKLFGKANTLATAKAPILAGLRGTKAEIDVSTSHCIRLHVEDAEAKRLIRQFRTSLARPYWRDSDKTERA
ncbi:hypothetical protein [Altererythrobacter sp. C41]|uniref:hypothetical protein n=1 Tax=Altererythrobacter sp. C41 TaxID=2806021 RepID=UPI0019323788|nr:hypothetical protein [Altererythrobacter sp. C41]MBM0169515.1 hypothetical protein [Altererythrobacter sp. C41]